MSDAAPESAPVPPGFWRAAILAVVRRPGLWTTALAAALRASPRGWWRRPPFVPRPDAAFLRFRFETAYGHDGHPSAGDFVHYLEWCRDRH